MPAGVTEPCSEGITCQGDTLKRVNRESSHESQCFGSPFVLASPHGKQQHLFCTARWNTLLRCPNLIGRREKTPTAKTRFSIWTLLRTPGRFTTRPLPVCFTTKMSVVRPFSVLSKDEIGPESKDRAVFLVRLKSGGRGPFPLFQFKV